jgi:hypothetical protein
MLGLQPSPPQEVVMSQVLHPRTPLAAVASGRHAAWLATVLALIAVGAVALVLALGGGDSSSTDAPAAVSSQPALRSDGGPDETHVGSSVVGGRLATPGPDESHIAASIGGGR